ncbi:MAG: hypothetical protein ACQRW7_05475, partial [Caulobacterales bacterium]|uniref:hypothetical protein n=1 Tax=Glycocaulis sp. TaxID=1969725 RepID=UPI003FA16A08
LGYPHSLRYYRCISVFPHKGLKAVSGVSSTEKIEDGASPTKEQAFKLARAINRNLSLIYKNGVSSEEKLRAIMYATAGSSLEGGWRNQIGKEGERVIKTLLLQHLRAKGELTTLAYVGGRVLKKSQITESVIEVDGGEFASAVMVNGSSLKFASEPDITILDNKGEIKAGVEIKAGLDPAGALERLGAMLKSFDALLYSESTAETVLIVSCLTDEVQRRILAAKSVTRTMMLTDITSDKKGEQQRFYTIMRAYLGLAKSTR